MRLVPERSIPLVLIGVFQYHDPGNTLFQKSEENHNESHGLQRQSAEKEMEYRYLIEERAGGGRHR